MYTKATDPAELVEKLRDVIAKAKAVITSAEGRELTADEQAQVAALLAEGEQLKSAVRSAKAAEKVRNGDAAVRAAITDLSTGAPGTKALPAWATKGARTERRDWAVKTADVLRAATEFGGRKSVVQGSYEVPSPIRSGVDTLPEFPRNLLDLLVTRVPFSTTTGRTFSFLQQTVRTSNAAPVPDGQLKPTSTFDYDEKQGTISTIAHITNALPLRLLDDYAALGQFLDAEMYAGVERAVEEQIVTGDGEDDAFTGLVGTSGVRVQAFATDLFTTMRKAATVLEINGEVPTAWAINPVDVEAIDLLQNEGGDFYYNGPRQSFAGSDPLWSLPVVKSLAIPAGTAWIGDWAQLQLIVREDAKLDVDQSGELFTKNQFRLRCEGRYGLAVLRPGAFCQVALAEEEEPPTGG